MSNLHGYNDYRGPNLAEEEGKKLRVSNAAIFPENPNDNGEDDELDPLRVGMWMEGDSLAPPCGSSIPLIHLLLDFGSVTTDDVVYDFGCGDGRICLEALAQRNCRQCVGIEIEEDLVEKAQSMISCLPKELRETPDGIPRIQVLKADLRECINALIERIHRNSNNRNNNNNNNGSSFDTLPMPTIIILYLLPEAIAELEEKLLCLLQRSRILCNTWGLPTVKESTQMEIPEENGASTTLFLYNKQE